jgi:hypothetical protein
VRVGERVRFDAGEYVVAGLDGVTVRLSQAGDRDPGTGGGPCVMLLTHLLSAPDFQVLSTAGPCRRAGPLALPDDLPPTVAERALWWERHLVEMLTGLAPDAAPGTRPRAEYDPAAVSLRVRETAKAEELRAAGEQVSLRTVQRMRRRYEQVGIAGLVDRRATRTYPLAGRVDERVVEAVREAMTATAQASTVSRATLMRQVELRLRTEHAAGPGRRSTGWSRRSRRGGARSPPHAPAGRWPDARTGRTRW